MTIHLSSSSLAGGMRALVLCLLALATSARGAVNNVAWYRLGEKDGGAAAGGAGRTLTTDLIGSADLRKVGSPVYSSAVASAAEQAVESSLCMAFNGPGQAYTNAIVTTVRNNFGLEAWVSVPAMPVNPGNYYIAMNGNPNANGWGLGLAVGEFSGPFYFGLLGGVAGIASSESGRTAHLALVRAGGVSTFYVNGAPTGTSTAAPVSPTGLFTIGAGLPGLIDEVRVFTFAAGEFTAADLLVNQRRIVTTAPSDSAPGRATLNGMASTYGLATRGWFEWGTSPGLGEATRAQGFDPRIVNTNFSLVLTGLSSGVTYFYRAVSSNALGVATGSVLEFSTGPTVQTLPPVDITATSALLNGLGDPRGVPASGWFEWGTTTNYGNATPRRPLGDGGAPTNFSDTVSNLFAGGIFHFRAVLSNGMETIVGGNRSFTTPIDASADLSIPGGVRVTIQPPGIEADGAQWTLDAGPAMFSGQAQGLVAPGRHTVRFRNLPNWLEPAPVEVYVVGGKTSAVSVVFSPIPTFALGTVPEQHARQGTTTEFFVNGVPPGASLQVGGVPPPAGPLSLDPVTGRVTYAPAPTDHIPFTLTFTVNGMLAAMTTITPLQTLPPEEAVLNYNRPLPDEESRDYITISETLSAAPELFNSMSNQVFTVDISGKTLVFETTHPAHLFRLYNARENIKELRLYADKVIIRSPLELPQTQVTIRARELRFEGNGVLDTTPRSRWTKPREVTWADDNFIGFPGSPGHKGGDVNVYVERFHADVGGPAARFVMRGGDGGPAGEGRNGVYEGGADPVFFPGYPNPSDPNFLAISNWVRLMARASNPTNCGISVNRLRLYSQYARNGEVDPSRTCGSESAVAFGEPAVPSGIPGAGGSGGTLRSTLNLSSYVAQSGGMAGAIGGNYVGGALVYQYVYEYLNNVTIGPNPGLRVSYTQAPKLPGNDATAPANTNGAPGSVVVVPDPSVWLHSFGLRGVVRFAKDAYLNGRVAEARALMAEYRDILQVLQPEVGSVTNLSEAEFAETTNLDQTSQEMGAIVDRIDMNLDFFGNPAGWVPMLSFEANLTAFQDEINRSIPILYLAYWMNYSATNLQNSALASEETLRRLREELGKLVEAYNQVQSSIPGLKTQSATIQQRIGGLHARLQSLEQELVARAEQNVEERHKVPFWKKAIGALAVAADLVPVGQPTVGRIGEGLKLLTQIDPEHPVQSALKITNAFGVMSNKDLSVCYRGSFTNLISTNRANRKEQLKNLSTCGKGLKSEFKELAGVFKEVQVDSQELQAEIEKLKASDPVFQEVSAELVTLNKEKERFAVELATALQAIATLAADMTENVLATDEMEVRVANQLAALDHNALVHIKQMERRAKERLLKFQYFTAQAFQYRLLLGFEGNFNLNTLFDRFQAIVAGSDAHLLSQQEFSNLKQLFQADLANTINTAMSALNANAPQRAQPRTFALTSAELQSLNSTNRQVVIDLEQRMLFPSFHEDIRIVNLRVTNAAVRPVGGPFGLDAVLFLDINHLGESHLSRGGQNLLFRHYQSATVSPIGWSAVLDLVHRTTNNSVLSPAAESLLRALLSQPTDANMLLFSRPAANAEILVRREPITDNGIDLAIDGLTIEVEYEFAQQSLSQRTLDVNVTDDLQPVIALNLPDAAQRQDGQGDFRRVYPVNTVLTLTAPAVYGGRPFDRWVINNVPRPAGSNSVTFPLTTGAIAEARYGDIPATGAAPSITTPPAPAIAMLGAMATFTVGVAGSGPLQFRWQRNGSALADDDRIRGTTTATLTISNAAPGDVAPYSVAISNAFGSVTSASATLTVTVPALSPAAAGPGSVGFEFVTLTGRLYIVERKFAVSDPVWTPVQTNNGTGGPLTFARPTTSAPSSFFRLRVE